MLPGTGKSKLETTNTSFYTTWLLLLSTIVLLLFLHLSVILLLFTHTNVNDVYILMFILNHDIQDVTVVAASVVVGP